jgi:hypothetical protein
LVPIIALFCMAGGFGWRSMLIKKLEKRGKRPAQVRG